MYWQIVGRRFTFILNGLGGGISEDGETLIVESTVSDNHCVVTPNVENPSRSGRAFGGGIAAAATIGSGGLTIRNSTISGNSVQSIRGGGGGIYCNRRCTIENTTVTGNRALGDSTNGALFYEGGTFTLRNSIMAGNSATGFAQEMSFYPEDALNGNNVLGDSSHTLQESFGRRFTPKAGDITASSDGTQPRSVSEIIRPLSDNGRPTLTHGLSEGGIAVDAGNQRFCDSAGIRRDQRGEARDALCDIGAFEVRPEEASCFVTKAKNENTFVYCL